MQDRTKLIGRGGRPRKFDEGEALGKMQRRLWTTGLSGASLDDGDALKAAIRRSFGDARPLAHNAFKVELAQRAAVRALQIAGERT